MALMSRSAPSKETQPTQVTGENWVREQDQKALALSENMVDALGRPFDFNGSPTDSTPMDLLRDCELNPTRQSF